MAVSNKVLAIIGGIMTLILIPLLVLTIITFVDVNNSSGATEGTPATNPSSASTIASTASTATAATASTASTAKASTAKSSTATASTAKSATTATTGTTKNSTSTPTKPTSPPPPPTTTKFPFVEPVNQCKSQRCFANVLLDAMDPKKNPCQDFYGYVCGRYIENHPLTNGQSSVSSFSTVQDDINNVLAKNFSETDLTSKGLAESLRTAAYIYQSCAMSGQQYPNPKAVLNVINSVNPDINFQTNGWPMITANWSGPAPGFNFGTLIADLDTLFMVPTLLRSSVAVDGKSVANNMLYISQATLGLQSREYYIDPLFNDVLIDYRELITNVSFIMCKNQTGGCAFNMDQLRATAQSIVDFETSIAKKTTPATELRNYTSQFNNFTLSEISARFVSTKFNWTAYFLHLLGHHFNTFPQSEYIVIAEPGFVDQLLGDINYFDNDQAETVINYLIWRFVMDNMAFVTNNPGEGYSRLKAKVKSFKDLPPSPGDCANIIVNYMPFVAGYVYIWNVIPDPSVMIMDVTDMINNILGSFNTMLTQLPWYDSVSLANAQKKISNMQRNVAYPPQSIYTSYLDNLYTTFTDIPQKTELQNYLNVLLYLKYDVQDLMYQQLSMPADRTNFLMSPALVNAWYQPQYNSITFPAAIMNPPYYQIGYPKYVNYGALGHVMGHELSHAFDDEGTQFNQNGMLSTWMTPPTQQGFQNQADCIQSEYNQFCYPQQYDYVCVNGINTQGENIADNGGIVAAFNAYQTYVSKHGEEKPLPGLEAFTSQQLFFISNTRLWCSVYSPEATVSQVQTDVHSPPYYRILGTYRNFDAFGESFNCTRGDLYYPVAQEQCPLYQPPSISEPQKPKILSSNEKIQQANYVMPHTADSSSCNTDGCNMAASLILSAMNSTVNPCDDFYQFSCGSWIQNTNLPTGGDDISAAYKQQMLIMTNVTNYLNTVVVGNSAYPTSVQTAKVIYDSCISDTADHTNEVLAVVNDLTLGSGWPIIETTWTKPSKLVIESLIGQLDADFSIPTLLSSVVDADLANPSIYSLGIDQASLALGYRQYYIDPRYTEILQEYTQLIINVANSLKDPHVNLYNIQKDAQTIVNIEVELARKTTPRDERRSYADTYHPYNLTTLQTRWPFFNWVDYLDNLLYFHKNPSAINSFVIMDTGYIDELHGDWKYSLYTRDYVNYLIWRYIYENQIFISSPMKQQFQQLQAKLQYFATSSTTPSQLFCSNLIIENLPYVAGDIYLKQNPPATISQAANYVTNVQESFSGMLNNLKQSGWLDDMSFQNAQNKMSGMKMNAGYSNNANAYDLDQYYQILSNIILNNFNASNNFFQNWNSLLYFNAENDFNRISTAVDNKEFVISPAYVGALYLPKRNVLNVAAGAMASPYFLVGSLNANIYGAFGSLVGHEMLLGFNDLGVQLNKNGGFGPIYTEPTMDKFSLMAQCLIGQYGQNCYPEQNYLCVDGTNTQGENIADNAGLIAAYNAYVKYLQIHGPEQNLNGLETYTNQQIFFMSYGQSMCEKETDSALRAQLELNPHPPNRDRVNNIVKNFDPFSQAFQCKTGDKMSPAPDEKCYVYTAPYVPPPPTTPPPVVSDSSGWEAAAQSLQASVNTTLDPCEDFYAFACDHWIQSNPITKTENLITPVTQLQKEIYGNISLVLDDVYANQMTNNSIPEAVITAAQAYHTCKTSQSTTYSNLSFIVNALIDAIGDWPMINPNYISPKSGQYSIFGDIGTLEAAYLLPTLLKSGVDIDWTNVQRPALYIDEATLVLERDYYIDPIYDGVIYSYKMQIFETSFQICNSIACGNSNDTLMNYAQDIVDFETTIARKKIPNSERRNMQYNFNEFNLTTLQSRWRGIDWNDYLSNLLIAAKVNISAVNVDFVILSPGYVDQLNGDVLVDATYENLTTITNYLGWRLVYQNLLFFRQNTNFPPDPSACVSIINAYMPFAIGNVYVNSLMSSINVANQQADFLTQIISNSFNSLFTQLPWQDDQTKSMAAQKLGYMIQNFGYPDWILDKNQLDAMYQTDIKMITRNPTMDFFQILTTLQYTLAQINFQQLTQKQPMSRSMWIMSPAEAAAIYIPQRNAFSVSAALFNQPFFDIEFPQAVNYGSLGSILGHELVHAFDDIGVQFSSNGSLSTWMTPISYYNYQIMADCVINKYSTYCYPETGIDMCVDGINTQAENIGDIGGLEATYRAYQSYVGAYGEEPRLPGEFSSYSMEQIFFMSYARGLCSSVSPEILVDQLQGTPRTPAKYRVNGAFMNFYKFGEAFNCPVGSPMFPPTLEVCSVFEIPPNPPLTTPRTTSTTTTTLTPPPVADNSTGYKDAAENIIQKMDSKVNPCSDFYDFACGQWVRQNHPNQQNMITDVYSQKQMQINQIIANNLAAVNINDKNQPSSLRTAATIYQSCMTDHSDDGENILSAINNFPNVFGWPIITKNWIDVNNTFDPFEITGLLDSEFLIPTLLESAVNMDWKNHTANMLYIQQATTALGDREFYINPYLSNVIAEYKQLIINTASYLNNLTGNPVPMKQVNTDAQSIVDFEIKLARMMKTPYEERDFTSMYNNFTLNEFPARFRNIGRNPWVNYFNALLQGSSMTWTLTTTAIVTQPGYVDELDGDFSTYNPRDYANYLMWRFVFAHLQFLPDTQTQFNKFKQVWKGSTSSSDNQCVDVVNAFMPQLTGYIYINQDVFQQEAVTLGEQVLLYIQNTTMEYIDNIILSNISTQALMEKFQNIIVNLGYPQMDTDINQLNDYYSFLGAIIGMTDYWSVLHFTQLYVSRANFQSVQYPPILNQFESSPAVVLADYSYPKNSMTVPLVNLESPFGQSDYPFSVNFGGLGVTLAHQIAHAFDDVGIQFNSTGFLDPKWLSYLVHEVFDSVSQCVVTEFSQHCYSQPVGLCINGLNTMEENQADIFASAISYIAYQMYVKEVLNGKPEGRLPGLEQYTPDQIYFLSYAQQFCENATPQGLQRQLIMSTASPGPDRVNGALRNVFQFGKSYNCKRGDYMYPPQDQMCFAN